MSAEDVTKRKRDELNELGRRFLRTRDRYIQQFWGPANAELLLRGPRYMPEELRRQGWGGTGLSARYNELAAKRASDILRSGWRAAVASAKKSIQRNHRLTALEKIWCRAVLIRSDLAGACLRGEVVKVNGSWPIELDQVRLSARLRKILLRSRPSRPRPSRRVWLEIDGSLYRVFHREQDRHFRGAWIAISGLTPRHRIAIPLAGTGLDEFASRGRSGHRPGVRVDVVGCRVLFRVLRYVAPAQSSGETQAGIDKGYKTLVTLSLGDPDSVRQYGADAHLAIAREADHPAVGRHRRQMQSYERSLRPIDPRKAARIRRRSLGMRKKNRRVARQRARLRDQVNRALNELFADREIGRLHVERLDFLSGRLARTTNRRLGRWLKGFLQQRLAHKAKLNGVELNVVNAAWTSLTCPRCWFPSKKNRDAERFLCRSCGYTGSADAIAATNVLKRGSDLAITRWTSAEEVRRILEERWRSALNGSARGLRENDDGSSRQAANNCGLRFEDRSPSFSSADELTGTIDSLPR